MSDFNFKSLCILGRQPALGVAELESVYGPEQIKAINGAALLTLDAADISFKNLGGTIKVARVLTVLDTTDWPKLLKYLVENVPSHMQHQPEGKFTLGLSVYGLELKLQGLNKDLLAIKKVIKATGKPARVVPNKSLALSSAQVIHNKLTHTGAWELILYRYGKQTILAQTMFVQDIAAYAARDQARPARDARVGMLPPKLAQIMVNLATGPLQQQKPDSARIRVLDPFCGTGVILQEAMLMGFSVIGSDVDARMVSYSSRNLQWLVKKNPAIQSLAVVEQDDAGRAHWPGFSAIASEVYLGQPLAKLPPTDKLKPVIEESNRVIEGFLKNLAGQIKPGRRICLAVPAWRQPHGPIIQLPLLAKLTDMGYTRLDLKHARADDLIYFREDQVVARQLLILAKDSDE